MRWFVILLLSVQVGKAQLEWFQRPSGTTTAFIDAAYGNGTFLALAPYASKLSSNGVTWTASSLTPHSQIGRVEFGGGVFMLADYFGQAIKRSADNGASATNVFANESYSTSIYFTDIAYGNGVWITVAQNGQIWRSTDNGMTWNSSLIPSSVPLDTVAFGNNVFIGIGSRTIATSSDGYLWNLSPWTNTTFMRVAFGDGAFVSLSGRNISRSTNNGMSWSQVFQQPDGRSFQDVAFGNGLFVAVGDRGTVYSSTDGIIWTQNNSGTAINYKGVTYGNGTWLAVGDNGSIISANASAQFTKVPDVQISTAVVLKWPTQSGSFYQVQSSTNLSSWENSAPPISGDGTVKLFGLEKPLDPKAFYRIQIK